MTATDQSAELVPEDLEPEPVICLELGLHEAEALRSWLLRPATDGSTPLDDPSVNRALTELAHAVDVSRATVNVRHELEECGISVAHLSDEQVRELGHRVAEAAHPGIRA